MCSRGFLHNYRLDATPDSKDSLEVKLLKDEVVELREQLTEARDYASLLQRQATGKQDQILSCFHEVHNLIRCQHKVET